MDVVVTLVGFDMPVTLAMVTILMVLMPLTSVSAVVVDAPRPLLLSSELRASVNRRKRRN